MRDATTHARRATMVAIALVLAGCAARPGPDVLVPVAAAPEAKAVTLYVATTRKRTAPGANRFTAERGDELSFARFTVSIPPNHRAGNIEWPTGTPDPRTSFATLGESALSRKEFAEAVAPARGRTGRRKVLVFIHGYNSTFQESLFRLAQMHADAGIEGAPILFSWPSRGEVAAYAQDRQTAVASTGALKDLFALVTANPQTEVMVVAHSMGGLLTAETLKAMRLEKRDRTIARLGRVVLAAPDIDIETFRAQVQAIGPLKPPMTLLVSKDDKALQVSSALGGAVPRAGMIDVENAQVREAAQKGKIQIVDISRLQSNDEYNHARFTSLAALYPRLQNENAAVRERSGTFSLDAGAAAIAQPENAAAAN